MLWEPVWGREQQCGALALALPQLFQMSWWGGLDELTDSGAVGPRAQFYPDVRD